VIARQSVWTDPEVAELARKFIPAADEVGRLQSGRDTECLLFQKIAEQGHYAGRTRPSSTRQGTYATTADGRLLSSWNSNDPRVVAGKLREAIAAWERLQAENRPPAETARLQAAELNRKDRFYPKDGLVLRVNTRDLPRDPPQEGRWADSWNQDFAWFKKDEARQFVPQDVTPGQTCEVPRALLERLARMHFVDNVRGQTTHFPPRADVEAQLTSRITALEGDVVVLRLEGRTKAEEEGSWPIGGFRDMNRPSPQKRGMELQLLGRARYDRQQEKFVSFELVATGTRWGGTQYNGRARDLAPAPFGALLTLAGDTGAERVAPEHFWAYGWK
jgi:hypothetical protein